MRIEAVRLFAKYILLCLFFSKEAGFAPTTSIPSFCFTEDIHLCAFLYSAQGKDSRYLLCLLGVRKVPLRKAEVWRYLLWRFVL